MEVDMGIIEEILKNKEEILIKFLEILEGKETSAKINLNGVKINVGKSAIRLNGEIELTFVPPEKKKK